MTTAGQLDNQGEPIQRVQASQRHAARLRRRPRAARQRVRPGPGVRLRSRPSGCGTRAASAGSCRSATAMAAPSDSCASGSIDPSDLNYPSIAVGDLAGTQTVTRTVTNVTDPCSVYVAKVQAPAGFTVKVDARRRSRCCRRASRRRSGSRSPAPPPRSGAWSFGSLTWRTCAAHSVRSPIAVRPVGAGRAGRGRTDRRDRRHGHADGARRLRRHADAPPFGLVAAARSPPGTWSAPNPAFDAANPQAGPAVRQGHGDGAGRHQGGPVRHVRRRLSGRHRHRPVRVPGGHGRAGRPEHRRHRAGGRRTARRPATTTCTSCSSRWATGVTEQDVKLHASWSARPRPATSTPARRASR